MTAIWKFLLAFLLLLPQPSFAAESLRGDVLRQKLDAIFAEAKSTEALLALALRPPTPETDTNLDNNIKARAYSLLAKLAEQPEEAAKIRPYVAVFLVNYDKPSTSDWLRARLARLLLLFDAAKHRHTDFILDLLKESDLAQPYPKWRQARETEALQLLARLKDLREPAARETTYPAGSWPGLQEPHLSQMISGLAQLLHQSFSHSPRVIEAALDVIDSYRPRHAAQTDALVQSYGKLQQVWQQQRESEAQSANSLTVWDAATEADVAMTLRKLTTSICGGAGAAHRNYVYIPDGQVMQGTGKPITIVCGGQEAR